MLRTRPFVYLRHGETDWNLANRCQGQTDVPLNPTGREQARRARDALAGVEIGTICASPLARAYETAKIVAEAVGAPIVAIDDLKECRFGVREGGPIGPWHGRWLSGAETPPGGETVGEFLTRALRGINAALKRRGPVLIVAHRGIYRAVRRCIGIDDTGSLANCHPISHHPPGEGGQSWRIRPIG